MATLAIKNSSAGWLVLWLEPLGEDRWLKAGERFLIRSDYAGTELPFSIDYWTDEEDRAAGIENVTVWVENGGCDPDIVDEAGNVLECGHQRPDAVNQKWTRKPNPEVNWRLYG